MRGGADGELWGIYRAASDRLRKAALPPAGCEDGAMEAESWELRAAMSLGRRWEQQGKRPETRELPAGI